MGKQDRFTEEFNQEAVVQVVENGQGPLRAYCRRYISMQAPFPSVKT